MIVDDRPLPKRDDYHPSHIGQWGYEGELERRGWDFRKVGFADLDDYERWREQHNQHDNTPSYRRDDGTAMILSVVLLFALALIFMIVWG